MERCTVKTLITPGVFWASGPEQAGILRNVIILGICRLLMPLAIRELQEES